MRDIVLFLGAGFSCDADLPVMSRFGDEAEPKHFRLQTLQREMTPELHAAGATYVQFRKELVDRGALSRSDAGNIETLFCVAEALREAGACSMVLDGEEVKLETIVARLRFWIWKVYHQLPFYNPRRGARLATYMALIDQLKMACVVERLTILTTNYDIVFEWVAHLGGLKCVYPLISAEECSVGAGPNRFVTLKSTDDAIPVLKLHGSINYFEHGEDDRPLLVATNISDGSPIAGRRFRSNIPAVVAVDALAQIRHDCGTRSVVPAIVPPGYAKMVSSNWLRETWSAALKALQEAKLIIFIGYSMPPSDGLLSSVFAGSLGTRRGSQNDPAVFVIDIDNSVTDRVRRVFGNRVRPIRPMSIREAAEGELRRILGESLTAAS